MTFREEMESMKVWLENNARTSMDVITMQNDMEAVLGYAERVATMQAEQTERISIKTSELLDEFIGNEDLTDFVKKTRINSKLAADVRLLAEIIALGRRLRDTKWLLMQACSIRKTELLKLH